MNIEALRNYCLSFQCVEESLPFGGDTLVFTVKGKMFCLFSIERYEWINVKCKPAKAILLREEYEGVSEGYHMNKKHWNSISTKANIPIDKIKEWIKDSYDLVVSGLPKKFRDEIKYFLNS